MIFASRSNRAAISPLESTTRIAFSATGELNRTDYGISWNNNLDNGAPMVGEKVRLVLSAEAALRKEEV